MTAPHYARLTQRFPGFDVDPDDEQDFDDELDNAYGNGYDDAIETSKEELSRTKAALSDVVVRQEKAIKLLLEHLAKVVRTDADAADRTVKKVRPLIDQCGEILSRYQAGQPDDNVVQLKPKEDA